MCGDPKTVNVARKIQAADVDTAEIRIRLRKTVEEPAYTWGGTATFQILTAMNGIYSSWGLTSSDFPVVFDEWQTVRIDLANPSSGAAWDGYSSVFQFHPVVCGYEGYAIDIDYIRFFYREDVKKNCNVSVTVDGQKLEKGTNNVYFTNGIFEFTFDEVPGVAAQDFVKTFLASNTAFAENGTVISEDGKTYTVYARTNLRGKTLSATDVTLGNITYATAYNVTFASEAKPGENIIINGDFSNPYLLFWGGDANTEDGFDTSIVNYNGVNALKAVFRTNASKNFRLSYRNGTSFFKENTKYLFRVDTTFPSEQNGFDMSVWDENSCNARISNFIYCPTYDWTNACDSNTANIMFTKWNDATPVVYPTQVKNINANNLYINFNNDNRQSVKRIINVGAKDSYSSTLQNRLFNESIVSLEARLSDTQFAYAPYGMYYYVNYLSVKELFDVSVDANGGVGSFDADTEVLYAKGEEFVFPENPFEKDGYVFAGWSYNGNIYKEGDIVTPAEIGDGGMSIKAEWKVDLICTAPESFDVNSIRLDSKFGIRFMSRVKTEQRNEAVEYGFLVARRVTLENNGFEMTDLTFDTPTHMFLSGAAYVKDGGCDKIYKSDDEGVFFTVVFGGIPEVKQYYEEDIVARPYIKYANGNIVYGEPKARSIVSVAKVIRDGGYENLNTSATEVVKNILRVCEENV